MGQNVSPAVMARRVEPHDSLDYFPTPPWATRALCEWLVANELIEPGLGTVWEPACGEGHMARPLGEYFGEVWASDVHDHGIGMPVADFLIANTGPRDPRRPDWVITNPPFNLGEAFVQRAARVALEGCAMFVRTAFLESVGRYQALFQARPPSAILQFAERVVLAKGVCRDPEVAYLDEATGRTKKPSMATAYCWIVWLFPPPGQCAFGWIGPRRRQLTRAGDYDRVPS